MPDAATLLVIDGIIDPRNGVDRLQKLIDLEQMFWLGGGLRTAPEWEQLLQRNGFVIAATHPTGIVDTSIMEAGKD